MRRQYFFVCNGCVCFKRRLISATSSRAGRRIIGTSECFDDASPTSNLKLVLALALKSAGLSLKLASVKTKLLRQCVCRLNSNASIFFASILVDELAYSKLVQGWCSLAAILYDYCRHNYDYYYDNWLNKFETQTLRPQLENSSSTTSLRARSPFRAARAKALVTRNLQRRLLRRAIWETSFFAKKFKIKRKKFISASRFDSAANIPNSYNKFAAPDSPTAKRQRLTTPQIYSSTNVSLTSAALLSTSATIIQSSTVASPVKAAISSSTVSSTTTRNYCAKTTTKSYKILREQQQQKQQQRRRRAKENNKETDAVAILSVVSQPNNKNNNNIYYSLQFLLICLLTFFMCNTIGVVALANATITSDDSPSPNVVSALRPLTVPSITNNFKNKQLRYTNFYGSRRKREVRNYDNSPKIKDAPLYGNSNKTASTVSNSPTASAKNSMIEPAIVGGGIRAVPSPPAQPILVGTAARNSEFDAAPLTLTEGRGGSGGRLEAPLAASAQQHFQQNQPATFYIKFRRSIAAVAEHQSGSDDFIEITDNRASELITVYTTLTSRVRLKCEVFLSDDAPIKDQGLTVSWQRAGDEKLPKNRSVAMRGAVDAKNASSGSQSATPVVIAASVASAVLELYTRSDDAQNLLESSDYRCAVKFGLSEKQRFYNAEAAISLSRAVKLRTRRKFRVEISPNFQLISSGGVASLSCPHPAISNAAYPNFNVQWFRNDRAVHESDTIKIFTIPGNSVLHILRVDVSLHIGIYRCTIVFGANRTYKFSSDNATLAISGGDASGDQLQRKTQTAERKRTRLQPAFVEGDAEATSVNVMAHEQLLLECLYPNSANVSWFRVDDDDDDNSDYDGDELDANLDGTATQNTKLVGNGTALRVDAADLAMRGDFYCTVSDERNEKIHTRKFIVNSKVDLFSEEDLFQKLKKPQGTHATLGCAMYVGEKTSRAAWYRNGRLIRSYPRTKLSILEHGLQRILQLYLSVVESQEEGLYECSIMGVDGSERWHRVYLDVDVRTEMRASNLRVSVDHANTCFKIAFNVPAEVNGGAFAAAQLTYFLAYYPTDKSALLNNAPFEGARCRPANSNRTVKPAARISAPKILIEGNVIARTPENDALLGLASSNYAVGSGGGMSNIERTENKAPAAVASAMTVAAARKDKDSAPIECVLTTCDNDQSNNFEAGVTYAFHVSMVLDSQLVIITRLSEPIIATAWDAYASSALPLEVLYLPMERQLLLNWQLPRNRDEIKGQLTGFKLEYAENKPNSMVVKWKKTHLSIDRLMYRVNLSASSDSGRKLADHHSPSFSYRVRVVPTTRAGAPPDSHMSAVSNFAFLVVDASLFDDAQRISFNHNAHAHMSDAEIRAPVGIHFSQRELGKPKIHVTWPTTTTVSDAPTTTIAHYNSKRESSKREKPTDEKRVGVIKKLIVKFAQVPRHNQVLSSGRKLPPLRYKIVSAPFTSGAMEIRNWLKVGVIYQICAAVEMQTRRAMTTMDAARRGFWHCERLPLMEENGKLQHVPEDEEQAEEEEQLKQNKNEEENEEENVNDAGSEESPRQQQQPLQRPPPKAIHCEAEESGESERCACEYLPQSRRMRVIWDLKRYDAYRALYEALGNVEHSGDGLDAEDISAQLAVQQNETSVALPRFYKIHYTFDEKRDDAMAKHSLKLEAVNDAEFAEFATNGDEFDGDDYEADDYDAEYDVKDEAEEITSPLLRAAHGFADLPTSGRYAQLFPATVYRVAVEALNANGRGTLSTYFTCRVPAVLPLPAPRRFRIIENEQASEDGDDSKMSRVEFRWQPLAVPPSANLKNVNGTPIVVDGYILFVQHAPEHDDDDDALDTLEVRRNSSGASNASTDFFETHFIPGIAADRFALVLPVGNASSTFDVWIKARTPQASVTARASYKIHVDANDFVASQRLPSRTIRKNARWSRYFLAVIIALFAIFALLCCVATRILMRIRKAERRAKLEKDAEEQEIRRKIFVLLDEDVDDVETGSEDVVTRSLFARIIATLRAGRRKNFIPNKIPSTNSSPLISRKAGAKNSPKTGKIYANFSNVTLKPALERNTPPHSELKCERDECMPLNAKTVDETTTSAQKLARRISSGACSQALSEDEIRTRFNSVDASAQRDTKGGPSGSRPAGNRRFRQRVLEDHNYRVALINSTKQCSETRPLTTSISSAGVTGDDAASTIVGASTSRATSIGSKQSPKSGLILTPFLALWRKWSAASETSTNSAISEAHKCGARNNYASGKCDRSEADLLLRKTMSCELSPRSEHEKSPPPLLRNANWKKAEESETSNSNRLFAGLPSSNSKQPTRPNMVVIEMAELSEPSAQNIQDAIDSNSHESIAIVTTRPNVVDDGTKNNNSATVEEKLATVALAAATLKMVGEVSDETMRCAVAESATRLHTSTEKFSQHFTAEILRLAVGEASLRQAESTTSSHLKPDAEDCNKLRSQNTPKILDENTVEVVKTRNPIKTVKEDEKFCDATFSGLSGSEGATKINDVFRSVDEILPRSFSLEQLITDKNNSCQKIPALGSNDDILERARTSTEWDIPERLTKSVHFLPRKILQKCQNYGKQDGEKTVAQNNNNNSRRDVLKDSAALARPKPVVYDAAYAPVSQASLYAAASATTAAQLLPSLCASVSVSSTSSSSVLNSENESPHKVLMAAQPQSDECFYSIIVAPTLTADSGANSELDYVAACLCRNPNSAPLFNGNTVNWKNSYASDLATKNNIENDTDCYSKHYYNYCNSYETDAIPIINANVPAVCPKELQPNEMVSGKLKEPHNAEVNGSATPKRPQNGWKSNASESNNKFGGVNKNSGTVVVTPRVTSLPNLSADSRTINDANHSPSCQQQPQQQAVATDHYGNYYYQPYYQQYHFLNNDSNECYRSPHHRADYNSCHSAALSKNRQENGKICENKFPETNTLNHNNYKNTSNNANNNSSSHNNSIINNKVDINNSRNASQFDDDVRNGDNNNSSIIAYMTLQAQSSTHNHLASVP